MLLAGDWIQACTCYSLPLVLLHHYQLLDQACVFSNMTTEPLMSAECTYHPKQKQQELTLKKKKKKRTDTSIIQSDPTDSSWYIPACFYSLPMYIYLSSWTACPVDFRLQHQIECEENEQHREDLIPDMRNVEFVFILVVLLLWLYPDWYIYCPSQLAWVPSLIIYLAKNYLALTLCWILF